MTLIQQIEEKIVKKTGVVEYYADNCAKSIISLFRTYIKEKDIAGVLVDGGRMNKGYIRSQTAKEYKQGLLDGLEERKIPKCSKTVTGRHEFRINTKKFHWITIMHGQAYKECIYCSIIDDRPDYRPKE